MTVDRFMKSSLILVLGLLALLLITPASAKPKIRESFESEVVLSPGNGSGGQQQILPDGTMYVTQAISTGEVTGDVVGSLWTQLSGSANLNTGTGSFQGKFRIVSDGGTFEGSVVGTFNTGDWLTGRVEGSCVGFGRGVYDKQKIKADFEGDVTFGVLVVRLTMSGQLTIKNI